MPWTVLECLVVGGDYLGCRGAAVPHCHFRRFAGARVGVRHGELAVVRLNRGLADGRRGPVGIEDGADLMKAARSKKGHQKHETQKNHPPGDLSAVKITRPIPYRLTEQPVILDMGHVRGRLTHRLINHS